MSVIVLDPSRAADIMLAAGRLAANGLATVPDMPADTNPGHFLATATPGGRLGWALAVARVASAAAYAMTYGDPVDVGGRPSWDPDLFDLVGPGGPDLDAMPLGDLAVHLDGMIGSALYNTVSNGGADFLPAAAAAILDGLRASLPVRTNGLYGKVPDTDRLAG